MPVEAVGAYLRELRERRGISLDEVSRQTRVPSRYLEALEASRLAELPAPVFVRGFIRAYCQALGEPPEHALARLDEGAVVRARSAQPAIRRASHAPEPRTAEARSRTRPAVALSLALLVFLGVALVSLTAVVRPGDDRRPAEVPGVVESSEVEQASPGPPAAVDVPSLVPLEGVSATPAAPPPATVSPVAAPASRATAPSHPTTPATPTSRATPSRLEATYRLIARTTETTWIRVRTGDGRTMEETIPPGAVREWVSDRPFELTVGNAGGVLLELNGTALPPLGASGAVISRLVVPAEPR